MNRLPMIIALLALLVAGIFGFGLNQQMAGLQDQIMELTEDGKAGELLRAQQQKIVALEAAVARLQAREETARKTALREQAHILVDRLRELGSEVVTDESKTDNVLQALELVQGVVDALDKDLQK